MGADVAKETVDVGEGYISYGTVVRDLSGHGGRFSGFGRWGDAVRIR